MDWKPRERHACGDCGAKEGEIHELGCDMEIFPFCEQQLLSCFCCYEKLEIDCSPGTWTYENGLTTEQTDCWQQILEAKGRVRYVHETFYCVRCGEAWPNLFHADDWDEMIPFPIRDEVLCLPCYDLIRAFVLAARREGH